VPLAVCATPIGNLDDITLRVLDELRAADVVLCEDTRHTRGLLARHSIEARLLSYHEHNEAKRTAELLPRLVSGERIALVSDAGMPGISDPGARLVGAALEAGVAVSVLPGPSAVESAVAFLPRGAGELSALWRGLAQWRHALVAFESPNRLPRSLASLAEALPDRPVAVCRELTKRFEEVARGPASVMAGRFADGTKGEITLVIGPGMVEGVADQDDALGAVADLLRAGTSRKTAAEVVSRLTGVSKKRLYDTSL
jgi:16S rRNA (cytidine1402-2'-O)-methyltransferase